MNIRLLGLPLVAIACARAEEPAPPAVTAEELRAILRDPNGDLARLAGQVGGRKGGNQLFYFPTRDEPATPAKWGFEFENVAFKSGDGTMLHGWFIPVTRRAAKGTVVFSHGNAGAIGHHLGFVMWLVEADYNVFMYDYRGFGKSGGTVDRRGMLDDVKAAFAHVSKRADVDRTKLISFGHSLGGAKSITALAEAPVKGLRAIVIDGAFSSYQAMARIVGGQLGATLVTDEWAPKDFVKDITAPLLVIHGVSDEVVPVAQGRQLYEAAPEPKTFFEVKSGRHGDSLSRDGGSYRRKMIVWMDDVLKG